jgi:hypothetical protein
MFEIVQIIWDVFMMRRSVKDGSLTLRKGLIAFGLTALGYLLAVPASVLYDAHPQYKPLFIAGIVLAVLDFAFLIYLGIYWWKHPEPKRS